MKFSQPTNARIINKHRVLCSLKEKVITLINNVKKYTNFDSYYIGGELRDGSTALELLKACNTGHRGGILTIHANSAKDTLTRLDQLISEVSVNSKMDLIKDSCDLIVFMKQEENRRYCSEMLYKGENI